MKELTLTLRSLSPYPLPSTMARYPDAINMLAITVLWLICVFVTNPAGAFPLNDDWAYTISVKHLHETREFRPIDWIQALHLSHAAWGYLFSWNGGWSDELLRASTLVMSVIGVLAMYLLSRLLGASRILSVVAALTLAFNPIYYSLSFTFMTDVPFTALLILAALGFAQSILRTSDSWLAIAVLAALAATLNRQIGLVLPVSYAVTHVIRHGLHLSSVFRALTPFLICAGALAGVEHWMEATGRTPDIYNQPSRALLDALRDPARLKTAVLITFAAAVYLGLSALPLSALLASQILSPVSISCRIVIVAFGVIGALTAAIGATALLHFGPLPWFGNIIDVAGIGPFTLRDTYVLRAQPITPLPRMFWLTVTICGAFGAALLGILLIAMILALRNGRGNRPLQPGHATGIFLALSVVIYFIPVALSSVADRYLLPIVPLLAAAMMAILGPSGHDRSGLRVGSILLPVTLLVPMLAYSVAGTHDYLAWNRARWALLDELLASQQINPRTIDGGYEFNGRYTYDPNYAITATKSWWWVYDDAFVLAFGPIPGYSPLRKAKYTRWLIPSQGEVLLLKRENFPQATSRQGSL